MLAQLSHMGLADVGLRVEHVFIGRRDIHVATHDGLLLAAAQLFGERCQPVQLVPVMIRIGHAPFGATPSAPGCRRTSPTLRVPLDVESRARHLLPA